MYTLAVGRLYNPERTHYPQTEQVRLGRGVWELVRYWSSPGEDEVRQHQFGSVSFAVILEAPDLLVLAYKFGTLDWSDSPFQAHRVGDLEPGGPEGKPGDSWAFRTVLVDADTGIIRALRDTPAPRDRRGRSVRSPRTAGCWRRCTGTAGNYWAATPASSLPASR